MWRGIPLADKSLAWFGLAIVLIVLAAMTVPWMRMGGLVTASQLEQSRQLAAIWLRVDDDAVAGGEQVEPGPRERAGLVAERLTLDEARARAEDDPALRRVLRRFDRSSVGAELQTDRWSGGAREYRYIRVLAPAEGPPEVVSLTRRSAGAAGLLLVNAIYLFTAGAVVLAVAVGAFWVMTHKIFLRPVRDLREAAERVRTGDLGARTSVHTGDEFEQLGETFNAMLEELQANEGKLRSINAQLDVRLSELSQANVALFETARLKGEFLANVSHELRTPLNSIIGFAELLLDIARAEAEFGGAGPEHGKRLRYLENIVGAGRSLLELINSLLEMAKLEAGRIEVRPEAVSLKEVCDGMVGLIHPQAQRHGVTVLAEVAPDAPIIETDLKKLQQILFNLLSNAVKFSGTGDEPGRVTLRAERLPAADGDERVRISVLDNGPGIDPEDQQRIFQKFQQADNSHTRAAGGAGLGLAICRQLASVLQGEIQLVSEPGRGSMFSLILPRRLNKELAEEIRIEAEYRAGVQRRDWSGGTGGKGQESGGGSQESGVGGQESRDAADGDEGDPETPERAEGAAAQ